jgi:hypothetical protein
MVILLLDPSPQLTIKLYVPVDSSGNVICDALLDPVLVALVFHVAENAGILVVVSGA